MQKLPGLGVFSPTSQLSRDQALLPDAVETEKSARSAVEIRFFSQRAKSKQKVARLGVDLAYRSCYFSPPGRGRIVLFLLLTKLLPTVVVVSGHYRGI